MASSQDEFLSPEEIAQTTQHAIASELPLSIRRFEKEISSGWKRGYIDPDSASPQDATDWMANRIRAYTNKPTLTLEDFKEDFGNWPLQLFTEANTSVRSSLRDLIHKKGIETKRGSGESIPKILYEIAKSEKAYPIVPTSPIRPPTPTNRVTEAEPTPTMQQMLLQAMRQSQQAMEHSMKQTRMMEQMMEQMTKLTVKQSTPRAPKPAQNRQHEVRPAQDNDRNSTTGRHQGSSLLIRQNQETLEDMVQKQSRRHIAIPRLASSLHPSLHARSDQMQTTTAAERRQHTSNKPYDYRSQILVAPEDCQRSLLLQSPPAQIQTDFDSQQARLAPGMYLQHSRASQVPRTRRQNEQPHLSFRTEAPMDCTQPLSTSIESQTPWTCQKETLFVPREQSTSALPIESKTLPSYLKQALPAPSTTPFSRHVHKQPPPCDRPQKQHPSTHPPQEQSLPTRQFDQACPPHAQRPAAFPLNAETSDDAVDEDIDGISDRSSDDSGEECFADALNGNESLVTTHQGSSEDSEEEEADHTSSMTSTTVYPFEEGPLTSPADDTSDEFPRRPDEVSDYSRKGSFNENSVVSTKDLVVGGHAENEDLAASHEDVRPEDAHIEEIVVPFGLNGVCPTELRKQESKERESLRGEFAPIAYTLSWEFATPAQTPPSEVGSFLHHDKRLTPPAPKLPLAPMLPLTSIRTLTPITPVTLTTMVAFMIMTPVINSVGDFVVRYRLVERLVP